mmetsp:Transcript_31283/g.78380  ORF Transcript_31283/g.78380 Transcript_31283/m.78380 type:complete len:253 (+) Transcript_31283:1045-1803(+)
MLTMPFGHVCTHRLNVAACFSISSGDLLLTFFSPFGTTGGSGVCAGSRTVLKSIWFVFCSTVTAPSSRRSPLTALLTPSAPTNRSYGADSSPSDSVPVDEKCAMRAVKSTACTARWYRNAILPPVWSIPWPPPCGYLATAELMMASAMVARSTATAPLSCPEKLLLSFSCRTLPSSRTTPSSGSVTPAPSSASSPRRDSTTLYFKSRTGRGGDIAAGGDREVGDGNVGVGDEVEDKDVEDGTGERDGDGDGA